MAEDAVFLSYAWGVDDDLVDRLYESVVADGFRVERDEKSIAYKGSISSFMNRLSDGGAVVVVLSDRYLRSVYCMQELYEIWRRHADFVDRIFPFVLPDARDIDKSKTRLGYARYWSEEKDDLEKEVVGAKVANISEQTRRELAYMRRFEGEVDTILAEISDRNLLAPTYLEANDFEILRAAVLRRLGPTPADAPSGTAPSVADARVERPTYQLGILLAPTDVRCAMSRWLDASLEAIPATHPEVLGEAARRRWAELDLRRKLFAAIDLKNDLEEQGLSPRRAARTARELLRTLVPLHPQAPPDGSLLFGEFRHARRYAAPIDVTIEGEALRAARAIPVDGGLGVEDVGPVVHAFFNELAQLDPEGRTPETLRREYVDRFDYYAARRDELVRRSKSLDELERPFYPVVQAWPELEGVRRELESYFDEEIYLCSEGDRLEAIEAALARALRELAASEDGPIPSRPSRDSAPTRAESLEPSAEDGPRPSAVARPLPEAGGPRELRWLHVSDLHFGKPSSRRDEVLDHLIEDARSLADRMGGLDLLVVTGDIAWSGQPTQFRGAEAWLHRLRSALGLEAEAVFLTCGNHDVDRPAGGSVAHTIHEELRRQTADELGRLLDQPDDEHVEERLRYLWKKLEGYAAFARGFGGFPLSHRRPYYVAPFPTRAGSIVVAGLNTALLSLDDQDGPATLALGFRQIRELSSAEDDRLVLVLLHHPTEGLKDGGELDDRLGQRAHLGFCGHLHQAGGEMTNAFGRGRLWFRAGAAHAEDTRDFTYSIGELSPLGLRLFPRVWAPRNGFVADNRSFRLDPEERNEAAVLPLEGLPEPLRRWLEGARR